MQQQSMTSGLQKVVVAASFQDPEKGTIVNEKAVIRKLNRYILTKFFLMTILCYIDRTNLAFAALQLNKSLGFSEKVYGIGSSVFFIGYSALQIPSNILLVRYGAPVWLSIIIIAWGTVATGFSAIKNVTHFYILRLLLGVAESGTFPGMWYHMSCFYSEREMGVAYAWISAGTAIAQVFGAPLAAILLSLDGTAGLKGWQWLFIMEGLPTLFLGVWINCALAESPKKAKFLNEEEANWLHLRQTQARDEKQASSPLEPKTWAAVNNWKTWYLALIATLEALVKNSIIYWCPLMIASLVGHEHSKPNSGRALIEDTFRSVTVTVKSIAAAPIAEKLPMVNERAANDYSGAVIAMLTALPFGSAALIMLFMAKHSAATGERKLHAVIPFGIAALALGVMGTCIDKNPSAAFAALLVATILWGPAGIIAALPSSFLTGPSAALGVAFINSIANIGGLLGPFMIGELRQRHESYQLPLTILGLVTAFAGVLVFFFPMERLPPDSKLNSKKSGHAEM